MSNTLARYLSIFLSMLLQTRMKRLQKVSLFSVAPKSAVPGLSPQCQLLLQSYPTGKTLKGHKLVDQFALGERYVLITDNDNLFEEVLHIYLLDLELNLLDEMDISRPFTPGVYQLCSHDDTRIQFRFFDEGVWTLRIHQQPQPRPLNYSPFPVRRPLKLWGQQYLSLDQSASG